MRISDWSSDVCSSDLLSVLPRGTGPLGFYEDATQRVPIEAIRLAADVPEAERSKLQVLRTDTPLFDAVVESRRNRRDDWSKRPAGHIDPSKIGRASWRERVGQYGLISVVGVPV